MEFFLNFPLLAALAAIGFAQFVKVPIQFIVSKRLDWSLLTSTGGMPSSHSAAVTALSTAIALEHGLDSSIFAVSALFAIITMFDATGVRRHAGEQATVLNKLVLDFNTFVEEAKVWPEKEEKEKQKKLKELLGHKPIEVFFGGLTGIILSLLLYYLFIL
ncbi:divergent PAP2 family protein [Metabacillus fastidiosus]|uniref:Divergent PAP2 family protein n=1 Tax=Metabacillus fastidiosus TaxID=1458 RepID=A0ABU6P3C3_9BACI|nr:divergent PAP2 family protein [Metabacillus fastidiosus]MEC2078317.1 divergent PAP2 family protein [Metabacillus fastidiosus]MED4402999.1 divergent PAP2 family protein [Metabacillus fastidiosus]MED4455229.1 divergent PAP2 family protein [Metabacillus fastidiosus]MED4461417.1 divergent PAP2 family protein [Metabacillus fastidiosus]MED4533848.1 divergent PAP2 family protein [Metabacillus fastidiosus]